MRELLPEELLLVSGGTDSDGGFWGAVGHFFGGIGSTVSSWAQGAVSTVSSWATSASNWVSGFANNTYAEVGVHGEVVGVSIFIPASGQGDIYGGPQANVTNVTPGPTLSAVPSADLSSGLSVGPGSAGYNVNLSDSGRQISSELSNQMAGWGGYNFGPDFYGDYSGN